MTPILTLYGIYEAALLCMAFEWRVELEKHYANGTLYFMLYCTNIHNSCS